MNNTETFDIVICGGGLAGLSLARQLSLSSLKLSILVLEAQPRPLPEAAFKVGESTIEIGAFYYSDVLQMKDCLETEHLEKLGLRYFYRGPNGNSDLATRPEYGVSHYLPAKSYQIDRGTFETRLRQLVENSGVVLREGVQVKKIELNGRGPHGVTWQAGDQVRTVAAAWVIDSMGRRRYLQNKLDLVKDNEGIFNAVWFRVRGKLEISDFVARKNIAWHGRVAEDRWHSTNHLMGQGYWVWLIPLAPDNTSVGIVASEEFHPFSGYNSYENALAWLERHEPLVARHVVNYPLLDFKKLKNYSYTSKQAFSFDRWACVGDAACFADPYYSVGSNMIGFANGFVKRFIELDSQGTLTNEYVDYANRFFLTLNDALTDTIHRAYRFHHNAPVMALKTIWDYYVGWTTTDPQFYDELYLEPKLATLVSGLISRIVVTQARMMRLFEEWGREDSRYSFEFLDYVADQPTLKRLHIQTLPPKRDDFRVFMTGLREAVDRIEQLAHVIFLLAVQDLLPDKLALFGSRPWINTAAISLDPERWEKDGLFRPASKPRDLTMLSHEIGRLFTLKSCSREAPAAVIAG
jgi:flavin-dependent dehydrogenase